MKDILNNIPLVSIIVPAYNVRDYVADSLRSAINQTYKHIEIIVIDDGSSDGTGDAAAKAIEGDSRCLIIRQDNRGVSAARNKAIEMSGGDYIAFLDPDDLLESNAIESMVNAASQVNADVVISRGLLFDNEGCRGEQHKLSRSEKLKIEEQGPVAAGQHLYIWNYMIDRSTIGNERFNTTLAVLEDTEFIYRVCDEKKRYAFCDDICYRYRLTRPGSALSNLSIRKCFDARRAWELILNREMRRGRPDSVISDYAEASFGLLRRLASEDRENYFSNVVESKEVIELLSKCGGIKQKLYYYATKWPKLMWPIFASLGKINK